MTIAVIGNYGATNIGDDAILSVLLKELKHHRVTVFSANPQITADLFGVEAVPLFPLGLRSFFKHGFRASAKALKKADVVILGGGGLFQDSRLYACFLWAWQIFWVCWYKKPLLIHAAGVGPLNTRLGRWLTHWAFDQAQAVSVRDEFSLNLLRSIGLNSEILVTADPVFLHEKNDISLSRTKNLFIISLRPWLNHNDYILETFEKFLADLKEHKSAEFIFVSMQEIKEGDLCMIEPLVHRFGGEIHLPRHFKDLLDVMEGAEFAIGMRYHFMVAALLTQTPLLPISYSPKTSALFAGTELETYLSDMESVSFHKLHEDIKRLSVGYNNARIYEKTLVHLYQEKARQGVELLQDFLKTFDHKKA